MSKWYSETKNESRMSFNPNQSFNSRDAMDNSYSTRRSRSANILPPNSKFILKSTELDNIQVLFNRYSEIKGHPGHWVAAKGTDSKEKLDETPLLSDNASNTRQSRTSIFTQQNQNERS